MKAPSRSPSRAVLKAEELRVFSVKPTHRSAFLKTQSLSQLTHSRNVFDSAVKAKADEAFRANESSLARQKREEEEKIAYELKIEYVTKLYNERMEKKRVYDILKARARKLKARIQLRPNDIRSLRLLVDVVYEMNDYLAAVQVIGKAVRHPELRSSHLFLLLGRCHLRRWKQDGTVPDLSLALAAYREAMRDPDLHRAAVSSPVPYFELAGLLLRLGKHQMALDTLSAVMTIFKSEYEWTLLGQYNVAQILVLLGDYIAALKLYQQLMMCPLLVEAPGLQNTDHCILLSTRLVSMLVSVEMAKLQQCLGKGKLAVSLFKECFERQDRYKYGDHNGGDVDIRFGHTNWAEWVASPYTFKRLGDLFRKELNLAMAAEMFCSATRLYEQQHIANNHGSHQHEASNRQQIQTLLGFVLDRGECLAELHIYEEAENCAVEAFDLLPLDIVVVGRAARCCIRGAVDGRAALSEHPPKLPEKNLDIIREADRVFRAVGLVQGVLRVKVARRRRAARQQLGYYATKIVSVVRMCLVRSRTAAARLDIVCTGRIGILVHSLRRVWKTGRAALEEYLELWNLSVKGIQHLIRMFIFRKRTNRVSRAVTACKKLWRGQRVRRALRLLVSQIQADLDNNVSPGRSVLYCPFSLTGDRLEGRERLSAGVNVLTNDQNLPVVQGHTMGEYSIASKRRINRLKPPRYIPGGNGSDAWFSSKDCSVESPTFAATASFCAQEELDVHVRSCASIGEDVPCLISVNSVKDDPTVKWIPFCILPDEGIKRLLTATALMLTSQSFSVMDCMRLVYVVNKMRSNGDAEIWCSIKSIFVQGTRIGPLGLSKLMSLGISHIHSLSLGGMGLPPAFGTILGQLLADVLGQPEDGCVGLGLGGGCSLSKLYIDGEPKFGNSGVTQLMKYLQFNTSLRILSLRNCRLKTDCVSAIAMFVSLSSHLEVLHLSDNLFSTPDCRVLVRSVANKGLKGAFRSMFLQGLSLGDDDLEDIFKEGMYLGVGIVAPQVGFRKELLAEVDLKRKGDDIETRRQREVKNMIDERARLLQLDLKDKNTALKEVFF